jgi:ABC-type transport system involved in multi-copper enzyme maturation permease subunit
VTGLVRSELRKLFTTRMWWGLLIGLTASSAALAVLIGATAGLDTGGGGTPSAGIDDPATVRSTYTAGLGIAYLFALALGILGMAGEYRHQTITATVLASPRRLRIVMAKLVALCLFGIGYGVVTVGAGLAAGIPVIAIRGGALRLTTDGVPRALLLAVVAVALWTVLGLGVGTLLRNQVLALLLSIGIAWIAEPLIAFGLNALDLGAVARFFPSQATSAIAEPSGGGGPVSIDLLPWWGGVLVLVGYATLSGALGAVLTLRRDIT